ncbi:MAG: ATP-binding cassette domain-containing protein [Acidimicrobiales bacterium]
MLSARGLVKRFGTVTALDGVDLDIGQNDVLGIVGDNGAGKSTFLSLLTGYHHPDSGEFRYRGQPVRITSPARTRRALGIEMVYQDLAMAPDLTVWQNLFLGEELRRLGILSDRRAMRSRAREVLAQMNTKIQPDWQLSHLSGGERQLVAVARGLLFDRDIILLDEPTAAISVAKVDDVLETIRGLHQRGKTVVLITHRLEDVLAVCTRVAVFVTGRVSEVVDNDGLTISDLIHLMFAGAEERGRRSWETKRDQSGVS